MQALGKAVDISWVFKTRWNFDFGRLGKRQWINWRLLLVFEEPTG